MVSECGHSQLCAIVASQFGQPPWSVNVESHCGQLLWCPCFSLVSHSQWIVTVVSHCGQPQ